MDRNQTPNAADVDRRTTQNQEEDNNCSICQETITNPVAASTCGHKFCSDCIKPWLEFNDKCPNCRAILPEGTHPQPAPYFEYENEGPEMETNWRPRRDSVTELRNQLAGYAVNDMTTDLSFLDETMMDLFEVLFPSPNARLLMCSIIRIRDTITFEIDIFSTSHDMVPRLDNLTIAEVRTFHETVLHIRRQISDLEMSIESLLRNVNARSNASEFRRWERLTTRWNLLCDEMVRRARWSTNASTRATPAYASGSRWERR
jgi:hypothetical protein